MPPPTQPTVFFAPVDHTRFMKKGKMAYLVARVNHFGGVGSFLEKHEDFPDTIEELYDSEQPPFFQPRDEWDHWDPATFEYPDASDDDLLIKSKLGKDGLQRYYFNNPAYKVTWAEHARCLWRMHQDLEKDDTMLLNDSISAVLRMLGNGLEKVATVTRFEIEIRGKTPKRNSDWEQPTPFLPDSYERIRTYADMGFGGARKWREACCGKRFFVGFFRHAYNEHFTTFIWDRIKGDLYHFDTLSYDQKVRAKNASLAWREHLSLAGQPYHFNFHSIPLTPQQGTWECGLLSTLCLFQTLRGLVGVTNSELATICPPTTLNIDGSEEAPSEPFDLLVRDWLLDSWTKGGRPRDIMYNDNLDGVRGIYQTMIMDEIGIKDGFFWRRSRNGKLASKRQSLYADEISYQPAEMSQEVPKDQLYTDWGGYVPADVRGIGHISNWRTHRLIPAPRITPADKGKLPSGPGPFAVLISGVAFPDLPAQLIKWYNDRGVEVKNNAPIHQGEEVILSDTDDSGKKKKPVNKGAKSSTPAPPDKTSQPWTPSGPLKKLSLGTPKRPRPSSNSGSEYQQSQSPSSSEGVGDPTGEQKTSGAPDQMIDEYGWGKARDGRPYIVEEGPSIRGAENFVCSDYESDEELASKRRPTGPATQIMSIKPGEKDWLGEVRGRPTQRLLTGNYATHIPDGLVRPSQWDEILATAAQPWMPATAAKESRDERMRKRQKSRDG
ncbi:hypothetical protein B0J15DRAFT_597279 [Fusarium solani]|uniref:Uncharacterized protein n=1 Tax=Fusarium solani TaxID=169388 RepID=A0A9P9GXH8_FUSSL|nr:uncharacterized protein B0J15DRAFT_597279 [Fusarium solani]KAH7247225.1 hypothetical protein B0J15DRAFT_597279 [Fusarium solani]